MPEVTDAPPSATSSAEPTTSAQMSAQGSHIWYELVTPDPQGAKAFYEAVVPGWTIAEPIPGTNDYRMIGRSDGGNAGGVLPLTDAMREHGARPLWLGYIGADDVDATVAQLEATGGKALMPAFDIPEVGRIALVADPQGNPFYLMKPIPPAGDEKRESDVFSVTEDQRVGWNELSTPDPVAARQFYGELFGWSSGDFMDMGEYGEYRFFDRGSTRIGAVSGMVSGDAQGWRYYIRVPSIAQSVDAVKSSAGTIAMGPMEVPGGDQIIVGQDPQGAEFALVGKA